jgi:hypothetical protein
LCVLNGRKFNHVSQERKGTRLLIGGGKGLKVVHGDDGGGGGEGGEKTLSLQHKIV